MNNDTLAHINQQIAELEAERAKTTSQFARQALDKELVALRQQRTAITGTVNASGNSTIQGPVVGVNQGTINAFFGTQPPDDAKELLDNYLHSLVQHYGRLRLGKLLAKDQSGREETTAPAMSLRQVYTSLTTDYWVPVADGAFEQVSVKELRKQMQEHNPLHQI